MTKTKKKKGSATPMNFKQLLGRVAKHEASANLLKTAVATGWLTDETFLTRVSEEEKEVVKEAYNENAAAKRAKAVDLTKALPTTVGPMAEVKVTAAHAKVTAGTRTVEVDVRMFNTMTKRHPKAMLYLSPDEDGGVIFSEKTTVAVIPPIPSKKEEAAPPKEEEPAKEEPVAAAQ